MATKESEGVFITTQQIYDKLSETSSEVAGMRADFKEALSHLTDLREDVKDHETRLRVVERLKYSLPLTAVAAIAAFVTDQFHVIGK